MSWAWHPGLTTMHGAKGCAMLHPASLTRCSKLVQQVGARFCLRCWHEALASWCHCQLMPACLLSLALQMLAGRGRTGAARHLLVNLTSIPEKPGLSSEIDIGKGPSRKCTCAVQAAPKSASQRLPLTVRAWSPPPKRVAAGCGCLHIAPLQTASILSALPAPPPKARKPLPPAQCHPRNAAAHFPPHPGCRHHHGLQPRGAGGAGPHGRHPGQEDLLGACLLHRQAGVSERGERGRAVVAHARARAAGRPSNISRRAEDIC